MQQHHRDIRKIDPSRGATLGDGTPNDADRIEIGPTQLAFDEWAAEGLELPNLEAMREAANMLLGEHDFASFQAKGSDRVSTVRHVSELRIEHFQESVFDYLDIVISANGFLYNMVRNIVGTLVRIGVGKEEPHWILSVLESKDRRAAGETAPAHGLFLERVEYDNLTFVSKNNR